jgi:methylenetetrahydrofolate reductase (NADPH)
MPEYLSKYQQSLLDKDTFSITWELVPGRGAFEKEQEVVIASAEKAAKGGKVHALTLTDHPSGKPAISAEMLGAEVLKLGIEPLVHFTCKDKSRNELEALLYGLERAGVRNLLVMTGDYVTAGYHGRSKPVFDLDSSQLLGMIADMNQGLEVPTLKGTANLAPTHFYAGAAVSPFKALESEQMGQYYKLKKKLRAGAQFIITQLGFDARKFHEALQMVRLLGYGNVPVIANLYVLSAPAARVMNRNGVPGCVVTDKLLAQLEAEAADKATAKARRLERAAKMYAWMKGMGFAGVHIGGHGLTYEDFEFILGRGEIGRAHV